MRSVYSDPYERMKLPTKRHSRLRRQFGQAIVEGGVIICLMIFLLVCFCTVMLFIGSSMYYTNQLTYVAQQAAIYGMNQRYYAGLPRPVPMHVAEANTQEAMKPLLATIGLPDAKVEFTVIKENGLAYGQATVSAASAPVLGGGASIMGLSLPKSLKLSQTALAMESDSVPPFIACVSAGISNDKSGCVQVPCVAAANPFNFGHSPAYFKGSIGGPGADAIGAPGYVQLPLKVETTANSPCRVDREPYVAGPGWAY